MDCDSVQDRLNALLDGELDAGKEKTIRNHIPNCIRCLRRVAEHRGVHSLLSHHRIDDPPASLKESVMEEVRPGREKPDSSGNYGRFYRRFSQAAVLLVGVLLGLVVRFWTLPPGHTTSDPDRRFNQPYSSIEVLTVRPTGSLSELVSEPIRPTPEENL